jgi:DNA-binding CsgD family transcriptional regulator
MLASSMSVLVEYDRALPWLQDGIAFAERVEQVNDRNYLMAHLGHVRWATGDWHPAEVAARQALADGGGITTRITALHVLGFLAMGRGATSAAIEHLSEAASLGSGMRELQRVSPAWWGLAEVALLAGDLPTAIERCEDGYAESARVRDAAYLFPYVVTGVRAHLAASGATAAREWLERTSALLTERAIPGTLGALPHARGLIELHEGQTGKARESLASAAAFWAGRRRYWEGTAALVDQARCATRSRRAGEAAEFLAAARRAYAGVGAPVPSWPSGVPDVSDVGSLSQRELEVARLVATGMTNREIAAALTIAPKTAAAHVEHIRTKLGVSRRAQIASWLAARD